MSAIKIAKCFCNSPYISSAGTTVLVSKLDDEALCFTQIRPPFFLERRFVRNDSQRSSPSRMVKEPGVAMKFVADVQGVGSSDGVLRERQLRTFQLGERDSQDC